MRNMGQFEEGEDSGRSSRAVDTTSSMQRRLLVHGRVSLRALILRMLRDVIFQDTRSFHLDSPKRCGNKVSEREEYSNDGDECDGQSHRAETGEGFPVGERESCCLKKCQSLEIEIDIHQIPCDEEAVANTPQHRANHWNEIEGESDEHDEQKKEREDQKADDVGAT